MSVVELRQYTLRPGQRDALIELFDSELVDPQEAVGAHVLGQFRDLDDPDRFVWLRAFRDMAARRDALQAFYGGPVWAAHRDAANATMVDSDDVLLLRPARTGSALITDGAARPAAIGDAHAPRTLLTATIYALARPAEEGFADFFEREVAPVIEQTPARPLASYVTEPAANTFPALPVREGEHVFVWFARFAGPGQHGTHLEQLRRSPAWTGRVRAELEASLVSPPQQLRLAPTSRSLLR